MLDGGEKADDGDGTTGDDDDDGGGARKRHRADTGDRRVVLQWLLRMCTGVVSPTASVAECPLGSAVENTAQQLSRLLSTPVDDASSSSSVSAADAASDTASTAAPSSLEWLMS